MIRNPDVDGTQDAVRRAVVATTARSAPGSSSGPQETAGTAGLVNEATGLFTGYGRLGMTPLGEGFLMPGTTYAYGRLGYTPLGSFRLTG